MRTIIGLALNNQDSPNAMFQISHTLQACGYFFSEEKDRKAAIEALEYMQTKMAWRTEHIIRTLKEQWYDS